MQANMNENLDSKQITFLTHKDISKCITIAKTKLNDVLNGKSEVQTFNKIQGQSIEQYKDNFCNNEFLEYFDDINIATIILEMVDIQNTTFRIFPGIRFMTTVRSHLDTLMSDTIEKQICASLSEDNTIKKLLLYHDKINQISFYSQRFAPTGKMQEEIFGHLKILHLLLKSEPMINLKKFASVYFNARTIAQIYNDVVVSQCRPYIEDQILDKWKFKIKEVNPYDRTTTSVIIVGIKITWITVDRPLGDSEDQLKKIVRNESI